MSKNLEKNSRRGAELVIDTLINEEFKHIFAIPGAKIDAVFDALVDRGLVQHFYGRVGLFRNQTGDRLLHKADLIISIGYDLIEYDPVYWNTNKCATLVHIDDTIDVIDRDYQPDIVLICDISATLKCIYDGNPKVKISEENLSYLKELQKEIVKRDEPPK